MVGPVEGLDDKCTVGALVGNTDGIGTGASVGEEVGGSLVPVPSEGADDGTGVSHKPHAKGQLISNA